MWLLCARIRARAGGGGGGLQLDLQFVKSNWATLFTSAEQRRHMNRLTNKGPLM